MHEVDDARLPAVPGDAGDAGDAVAPPLPARERTRPGGATLRESAGGRAQRILRHEARRAGAEAGIAPPQRPLGGADATVPLGAKAALPLVEDEGGVVEAVLPPGGGGAQAEIDLFAVAETESGDVERADLGEQRAPDEEAEPDRRRHLRPEARRGRFDERGEVVDVAAGRQALISNGRGIEARVPLLVNGVTVPIRGEAVATAASWSSQPRVTTVSLLSSTTSAAVASPAAIPRWIAAG